METPKFGYNRLQKFVEFFMNPFRVRVGIEGTRIFKEIDEEKYYIDTKKINQTFSGVIDLTHDVTHYNNYSVTTDVVVTASPDPIIGSGAEIRMIGDGSHVPDLSAFTKSSSSDDYNDANGAINKIIF